jgi:hypothetical protein
MKTFTSNATSNKRPAIHISDTLPNSEATNPASLHIMEIKDHKTLLHKTVYHVNQSKTNNLTAKHLCQHIHSGFTPEHLARIRPEDEGTPILAIPFEVTWKAVWLSEDIVRSLPNGNPAIHNYKMSKLSLEKKQELPPPNPPASPMWMAPPPYNLYHPPD